jgi:site-specific DNA-methyltransferase (adenine-specific)
LERVIIGKVMEKNVIYNLEFEKNKLPDGCADLIIADPPYYGIKGDFDFGYEFDEYIARVEEWAKECKRLLRPSGTLIWYGNDVNIAYNQVVLDKYFTLLNNCVIDKIGSVQQTINPTKMRKLASSTERFLLYEYKRSKGKFRGKGAYDSAEDHLRGSSMEIISSTIKESREKAGLSIQDCDRILGRKSSWGHYEASGSGWRLLRREVYEKMQDAVPNFWNVSYEELLSMYEKGAGEYQNNRRTLNITEGTKDIFQIKCDSSYAKRVGHPTPKDERLTARLINMTTNQGALVIIPFAGSGTECAMCAKYGRDFIGFEIDASYAKRATLRANSNKTLF